MQHVDEENSYLCGYLQINGLTDEYPTLTTFFDGEIISQKYPFLTRKWDADEDVDKKHWVIIFFEIIDWKTPVCIKLNKKGSVLNIGLMGPLLVKTKKLYSTSVGCGTLQIKNSPIICSQNPSTRQP